MEIQQVTASIEKLIAQGQLEQALDQLVALLNSDPKYAELAQIAKINQGDLYQIKSQVLKNTISNDEARLANNQIADHVLQITRQLNAGQLSLEKQPTRSQAWRYYVAGGIVTLAGVFLIWKFVFAGPRDCPRYKSNTNYRVMILPFRQTGENKNSDPAIEIADGLNVLISKTPNLKNIASAEVKASYTGDYPSPQMAEEIAEQCGVQMIVWGKINQTSDENYKLDVRYRLLNGGKVYVEGDTSVNNLLKTKDQGQLIRDLQSIYEMLYIVLANKANVPVENSLFAALHITNDAQHMKFNSVAPDTSMLLLLAANVYRERPEEAIQLYDQVLSAYPNHNEARQKRGALLYQSGDFAGAVRDLEFAAPNPQTANPELLRYRAEAALQSGQPLKAEADLKILGKKSHSAADSSWIKEKKKVVQDSLVNLRAYRDQLEKAAKTQPKNVKNRIKAAKANVQLGEPDRGLKLLDAGNSKKTQSAPEAVIAIEAYLQKRDTINARKTYNKAEKAGLNVKGIQERFDLPTLSPAATPKKQL
jgi:tetratricopeptide (TPR) repeat protein